MIMWTLFVFMTSGYATSPVVGGKFYSEAKCISAVVQIEKRAKQLDKGRDLSGICVPMEVDAR